MDNGGLFGQTLGYNCCIRGKVHLSRKNKKIFNFFENLWLKPHNRPLKNAIFPLKNAIFDFGKKIKGTAVR